MEIIRIKPVEVVDTHVRNAILDYSCDVNQLKFRVTGAHYWEFSKEMSWNRR